MAQNASKGSTNHGKLPKLPPNARIHKRRLTRAPIVSKGSSNPQIIYISSRTPFMSAISRIRKHVTSLQTRRSQSIAAASSKRKSASFQKAKGDRILAAAIESLDRQENSARGAPTDEVLVKGTGKAIEKLVSIAGWLQEHAQAEGVRVRLETESWWAVDDVSLVGVTDEEAEGAMDVDRERDKPEDLPESRQRNVSVLTIRVGVL
ncbi:uncharacterized protein PV09_04879 [Verruconis gallopava]|uniref:Uncharacterized protein n=1 Tax=Verruconis gallopava TaxID=253628 RepID=A0A0D1XNB1_9PEZI|nr:uncharacterized protein PV09_04879 [Verruconis gallopava]KIW04061.1 hypothetical protein PV09_04879 [Verruconis gallopava]